MPRGRASNELTVSQLEALLAERRKTLQNLQKTRASLQQQLDAVDRQIARLSGPGQRGYSSRSATTATGRVRNETSLVEAMDHVMIQAGAPMRVGDILDAVLASGYRTQSANFRNIINQTLIKDKRFLQTGRGTYAIHK